MPLHLHESILLLSLDDEKGSMDTFNAYVNYGFAAALLMDLILQERLIIEEGRVKVKTNAITDNKLLNEVLRRVQDNKKNRKPTYWIHYLVERISKLRPQAYEALIRRGILEKREEKLLWIFKVNRYPSKDSGPENTMRERLRQIVLEGAEPTPKERILLAIVQAAKFDKELFPDKAERKQARERIEHLIKDTEMRKHIGDAILEMQAAVMVSTTAATM